MEEFLKTWLSLIYAAVVIGYIPYKFLQFEFKYNTNHNIFGGSV